MRLGFLLLLWSATSLGAERYYDLRLQHMSVDFAGRVVDHALGIAQVAPVPRSASIPAPTLRFRLGDEAVIAVTNETTEPATLHWHGVLVPWRQDGPQFTNTKIIEPGAQHTFHFPIRQTGTYWYHSHTEFQEQRGLYGAIVIEDEQGQEVKVDHDLVYVMSDWTNELPRAVLYNIKRDGHYYGMKKQFLPNIWDAVREGKLGEYLRSEWQRMGPMDLSDVGYDAFLVNGEINSAREDISHGQRVRIRIINAAASSYFYFNIGRMRPFKVISKDGQLVQPMEVNELLVAIGETYDIVFEVPHLMRAFEAKATAQDITGSASLLLGAGEVERVPPKQRPDPYSMGHEGHEGMVAHQQGEEEPQMDHGGHHQGDQHGGGGHDMPMGGGVKRLDYGRLKSLEPSSFADNLIRAKEIDLELSGDMERYTWHINGKPFTEDKFIDIRENEVITFRMINTTMMHHPMHLHGHFFRLLNGQGEHAPRFHTVDVSPMGTVTIEFHANEPGIWFLHCHNLYHMKMGMSRLVRYEGFELPSDLQGDREKWESEMIKDSSNFWSAGTDIYSNMLNWDVKMNGGRWLIEMELELRDNDWDNLEVEALFHHYLSRFLAVGPGVIVEDQEVYGALVGAYNIPGNVEMVSYLHSGGQAVVKLHKHIPVASIGNQLLTLELESETGYDLFSEHSERHFEWKFESDLIYQFNNDVGAGFNFQSGSEHGRSVGVGIKVKL